MFAYFIGGPWDLTKRSISEPPLYYNVAEMSEIPTYFQEPSMMPERVSAAVHTYRRMQIARDVVVYVWDRLL